MTNLFMKLIHSNRVVLSSPITKVLEKIYQYEIERGWLQRTWQSTKKINEEIVPGGLGENQNVWRKSRC